MEWDRERMRRGSFTHVYSYGRMGVNGRMRNAGGAGGKRRMQWRSRWNVDEVNPGSS